MNDLIKKTVSILMEADRETLSEVYCFVKDYIGVRSDVEGVAPVQPENAYREAIIALIICNDDPEYL